MISLARTHQAGFFHEWKNRNINKMLTSFAFSKPAGKYILSYTLKKWGMNYS